MPLFRNTFVIVPFLISLRMLFIAAVVVVVVVTVVSVVVNVVIVVVCIHI